MSLQIAFNYLLDQLRHVQTVKSVRVKDEGALVVELEQPGFIENVVIYLIAGELSPGFIKKAVNGNTRLDVNTLVIVSADRLPDEGTIAPPNDAISLLLDLYAGKIYAFQVDGRRVRIFPVYINQERQVSYGEPVKISHLGIGYAEVYSNYIWGVRKVADFEPRVFHHRTGSPRVDDPLQPYYDVLGISTISTETDVKRAYRRKARQHHPDTDKSPGATERMQRINEAYQAIMKRFGY